MSPASKHFLLDLLSTPSPTGFEVRGQRKWAAYARQFADRVESDAYGTAWATLDGAAKQPKRIMFEAHADEIGYMVTYISKEGFISVDRVGGSDVATARGRRVDILGDKGHVRGLIGNIAIHIRENRDDEKAPKVHELWIDIGAESKEEALKLQRQVLTGKGPKSLQDMVTLNLGVAIYLGYGMRHSKLNKNA